MKCVLLAAGPTIGGSYGFPPDSKPKCLFHFKGKVVLEGTAKVLRDCGIEDIRVVVGYKAEMIEQLNNERKLGLTLIHNPTGELDSRSGGWRMAHESIRRGIEGIDEDVLIGVGDVVLAHKGLNILLAATDRLVIGYSGHGFQMFKIGKEYLPLLRKAQGRGCGRLIYDFCMAQKGIDGFGHKENVYFGSLKPLWENYLKLPGIQDVDWYWQTDEGIKEGAKRK